MSKKERKDGKMREGRDVHKGIQIGRQGEKKTRKLG